MNWTAHKNGWIAMGKNGHSYWIAVGWGDPLMLYVGVSKQFEGTLDECAAEAERIERSINP